MFTHIDLFSGIGGFALAAQWAGFKTVAFVEIELYAQELIKQNFGAVADADSKRRQQERRRSLGDESTNERRATHGDYFVTGNGKGGCPRLFADIRTFDGTRYRGATLLTGGFPCQPFSQAGKRRGKEDDRYLWPEMLRVIHEARPAWVLGENVAGIVTMELDRVLSDLESEGYAVQALVIPACAVDAKHRRDRVWIVGHAEHTERRQSEYGRGNPQSWHDRTGKAPGEFGESSEDVADAARHEQGWQEQWAERQRAGKCGESDELDAGRTLLQRRREEESAIWFPEPDVGRVAHGISARVDRLKGLGNSIVPQVAYEIIKIIADIERGVNEFT